MPSPISTINLDFNNPIGGVLVVGAASVTSAIPAGTKVLGIATAANCHFRLTTAALATAVGTDPLLNANAGIVYLNVPGDATNISVIQDGTSAGNFSYFKVGQ